MTSDREDCKPCIVLQLDEELADAWERYRIQITPEEITIGGGHDRALTFGIYHFLEHQLGVDPLYFWSGIAPARADKLVLDPMDYTAEEPAFKYRGWFINDEDLLTEWMPSGGKRNIRYPYYGEVVNPKAMAHVVEAAVRLRFNLIIPASFLDIKNPPERALIDEASRRGLYVSMHHIEPLGVSAFTYQNYWKERGEEPLFSFYNEPEKVEETWRAYAAEWAKYDNVIWQVGLRGIGDRPMWMADPGVPQSDEDRAGIISDAMALQKEIIKEITGADDPVMTTTLWAEGSYFNQRGLLKVPEGVITVFADNNPGWHWQADFYETEREAGRKYGVYYHHQVWGWGPHLAQAIPPKQTARVVGEAYSTGAKEYAIMNVGNVREFLPGLAASSDMLWDMDAFDGQSFLAEWTAENFPSAPEVAHDAYAAYFDGYAKLGTSGMPGFLDGQSKHSGQNTLDRIGKIRQEGYTAPPPGGSGKGEVDPFHAALSSADPARGLPLREKLTALTRQIEAFERADSLTFLAYERLATPTEKQLLHDNLRTHLGIQLAIGKWYQALMRSELAMQAGDVAAGKLQIGRAAKALAGVAEIKAAASTGKWENWYRGDKKMNVPEMEERTGRVLVEWD